MNATWVRFSLFLAFVIATGGALAQEGKASLGLKPLTEMTAEDGYKGRDGGLYGGGRNTPPKAHLESALRAARKIRPLDSRGNPADEGKIVFLSCGMSNTTQEFGRFVQLARAEQRRSSHMLVLDGAQGGQEARDWADPENRFRKERPSPWEVLDRRLKGAGVSPLQVQALWMKQARRRPAALGAFPKHAEVLKEDQVIVLNRMKERFPNLRLAYLSSRIYAGHARSSLNPEPFAYESAFSVRWLIREQVEGRKELNHDPEKGKVRAPLVLWGPYLWADGDKPRKADGLVWLAEDLARDGTHPSLKGRQKVAKLILGFMKTDPTAKLWFKWK